MENWRYSSIILNHGAIWGRGVWSASRPCIFAPGETAPVPAVYEADLNNMEKKKSLYPPWN
jgi:hypothetical protein